LRDKAEKTAELLMQVSEINEEILKIVDKHDITTLSKEEIMMYDTTHALIYKSGVEYIHFPNSALDAIRKKKEVRLRSGDRETIGILEEIKSRQFIVIASAIDVYGYKKLENLSLILSFGWLASVVMIFFAGRYFSENALRPITEVVQQVDQITASNLNMHVKAGNGQDEIAQLAEKFNRMLERLEEAFVMQKNFVANASHELRTPLTSVTGQIEVTLMQERTSEEYIGTFNSILDDVKGLTKMSNGLLELAKISSDQASFKLMGFRLDDLIWQTRSELLKKFPSHIVNVDFENFPEEEDELTLEGNANLLKTAFINLMDNACKFSPNHRVDVLVIFTQKEVKMLFMDTGIGINKEDIPHIFQPFYRSQKNRPINGFGIGLSLVDKIMKLHKGNVEVNSAPNTGTIFTVSLPKKAN
jgi:signal transduction histidine kinase